VFVVRVEFLADHAAIVVAASGAEAVGQLDSAAVRAGGFGSESGFPVSTTMSLIGVTNTLLGNWHGEYLYLDTILIHLSDSRTQIRSDDSYKKIPATQGADLKERRR